jgi:hypothetical protein
VYGHGSFPGRFKPAARDPGVRSHAEHTKPIPY